MDLSQDIEVLQLTECRLAQQRLIMQYAVSCILMEAATLEEAASRTLRIIGEGQGWEAGNFWLLDAQTSLLYCSTTWHVPSAGAATFEAISKQIRLPRGIGLPGRVWATGTASWIPNIQEDDNFPRFEVAQRVGLHGAFAFPIRGSSGFLGVIEFFSQQIRSLDEELTRTVITIGHQIGQFIEKKRTEEEHRRLLDHLQVERARLEVVLSSLLKLAELLVSVPESTDDADDAAGRSPSGMLSEESKIGQQLVELTRSIVGCERVSITAVDPETNELRSVAVAGISPEQEKDWRARRPGSYLSSMFQGDPPLLPNQARVIDMTQPPFSDYPNPYRIQTMLLVPMCVADQIVGLLALDHGGARYEYTEEEIALSETIAKLAAIVIERERLLQERAESRANELSLREANRRMDEFLSIVSHELRSPLTSIKGNIQLAQRRLKGAIESRAIFCADTLNTLESAGTMLARAERQMGVLNRLVDDLIDISRIQADKLELQMRPILGDLASILKEVVQEQSKIYPERTIRLILSAPGPVTVSADADRIGQVVTNYLTNALKYSAADRPVEVLLQVEEQAARVCVHDEGPGLSLVDQERIWERFYQVENVEVQTPSKPGLGLGLYISKTIIEQHHGQVGVQSSLGSGSTFWFTLPLAA